MSKQLVVQPGDTYGSLEVLRETSLYVSPGGHRSRRFSLLCRCGKETKALLNQLRSGKVVSCGCLVVRSHGLSKHPLYQVWKDMHQRCYNKKCKSYSDWGGRGIKVCKRWHRRNENGIQNFIADMYPRYRPGLSIDRIDNDGSYNRKNCKWSCASTQQANKRKRSNLTSIYFGVSMSKSGKWVVFVKPIHGRHKYVGRFSNEEEAARAYDNYIVENGLKTFRQLNFAQTESPSSKRICHDSTS